MRKLLTALHELLGEVAVLCDVEVLDEVVVVACIHDHDVGVRVLARHHDGLGIVTGLVEIGPQVASKGAVGDCLHVTLPSCTGYGTTNVLT